MSFLRKCNVIIFLIHRAQQQDVFVCSKTAILGGKTLFECGCSVAQDGSNILINSLFSDDTVKTQDGEVIQLNTFGDKLNYYYQEAGGAQGLFNSMATAGILSFASDYVDVNKISKN